MLFAHFDANLHGRDLAVGDIHGCFGLLDARLAALGFAPSRDRLFSVGDLVDRGPDSARAADYLAQPWFHAVRGNHEQMALDYLAGEIDERSYADNGGRWLLRLPEAEQRAWAGRFAALPLAIEVQTARGAVGMVHADCPSPDWGDLRAALEGAGAHAGAYAQYCLWSRDRISRAMQTPVAGVELVLVGHTPVRRPARLGNVVYLDTGAVYGGELTVADLALL
jgi:serine/threonine protein phosphatase 1